MTLDPISIATAGYVCGSGPDPIAIATDGYVCFAEAATVEEGGGSGGPGAIRREQASHGGVIVFPSDAPPSIEGLPDEDAKLALLAVIAIEEWYE